MTVAIVTKFLGPTDYRGARIVATVPERIADRDLSRRPGEEGYEMHRPAYWRLTLSYPYDLSPEEAHRAAAQALADRLGWTGTLHCGALATGYAFVFGPDEKQANERCAFCGALMNILVRGHHHTENGVDVTRTTWL